MPPPTSRQHRPIPRHTSSDLRAAWTHRGTPIRSRRMHHRGMQFAPGPHPSSTLLGTAHSRQIPTFVGTTTEFARSNLNVAIGHDNFIRNKQSCNPLIVPVRGPAHPQTRKQAILAALVDNEGYRRSKLTSVDDHPRASDCLTHPSHTQGSHAYEEGNVVGARVVNSPSTNDDFARPHRKTRCAQIQAARPFSRIRDPPSR